MVPPPYAHTSVRVLCFHGIGHAVEDAKRDTLLYLRATSNSTPKTMSPGEKRHHMSSSSDLEDPDLRFPYSLE
jgi:hypothetical protein